MSPRLEVIKSETTPSFEMINGQIVSEEELKVLHKMNEDYAHVVIGGKHKIVSKADCSVNGTKLVFGSLRTFRDYFMHLPLIANKNRGAVWLEWEKKSFYKNGISFSPNKNKLPKDCYNLFDGWPCIAKDGDCSFIINHIENVLCNGNIEASKYFIQWLAHIFQYPEVKPTIAIYIRSVEGTGKGSLFRLLQKMLGVYCSQINGAELLTRNFNGILMSKLLIFADEVQLLDQGVYNKMKAIISETTCELEKKGIDTEPMANVSRILFAGNFERAILAGKRERRFLLIEASSEKLSDKSYWNYFNSIINKDYAGKFLYYLLHLDLTDFDPYNAPMTKELVEEKVLNFEPLDKFLFQELSSHTPFNNITIIPSATLTNTYIAWTKKDGYLNEIGINITAAQIRSSLFKRVLKLGMIKEGKRVDRGEGIKYRINNLNTLKENFAADHGLNVHDLFNTHFY